MQAGCAPCCPQLVSIISQEEVTWRGAPGNELEAELRLWPDRQGERWGEGSEAGSPLNIRNHHHSNCRSGCLQVVAVTWSERAAVSYPQASFVPGADSPFRSRTNSDHPQKRVPGASV